MEVVVPRWSSWSFLVYAGGFTVLGAALSWLAYFSVHYGDAAYTAWALLVLVLLAGAAHAFLDRGHRLTAGVFAFAGVAAFAAFAAALFTWFGWLGSTTTSSTLRGFDVGRLTIELLTLVVAAGTLQRFRHPLLVLPLAFSSWLFLTDLLSGGGDWSAVLSFFLGIGFLGWAVAVDGGDRRPYGFWLHVAAGLAIGGSLLNFWHGDNVDWILIALASLAYVRLAVAFSRSSWAVLGAAGLLLASAHFALAWASVNIPLFGTAGHHTRGWVPPLVFSITGLLLVVLGLQAARRERS